MRKGEKLEIQSIGLESKTIRNQNWFSSAKVFGTSRKLRLSMKLKEHIDSTLMIPLPQNEFNVVIENVKGSIDTNGVVVRVFVVTLLQLKSHNQSTPMRTGLLPTFPSKVIPLIIHRSTITLQMSSIFTLSLRVMFLLFNSLPTYPNTSLYPDNRQITFGSQDVNTIITIEDHGFFTGDGVFYSPGTITLTKTTPDGFIEETQIESKFRGVDTGVYYIYKINENQFSLSRRGSDIYAGVFVQLTTDVLVENNTLTFYPFVGKGLDAQPIIRQFTDPVTPERPEDTLTLPENRDVCQWC